MLDFVLSYCGSVKAKDKSSAEALGTKLTADNINAELKKVGVSLSLRQSYFLSGTGVELACPIVPRTHTNVYLPVCLLARAHKGGPS